MFSSRRRKAPLRATLLVCGLCLLPGLFGPPPPLHAEPARASVTIIKPRVRSTVVGRTAIKLNVVLPGESVADRVEVWVDGRLLKTLSAPPWELDWDAGDGSLGHRIEAILHLAGGGQARSTVRTSPLRVNQIEAVDLVNLYLVVREGSKYVTDLGREDFRILENRRPQKIERFSTTHKPLFVAIVLDASLSMEQRNRLEPAKKAALSFLGVLEPEDRGMIVTFSDSVRVDQELTSSKALLAAAIERVEARRGTALYDAIWRTSRKLQGFDGRRVLVLLSDGRDESADGLQPGSLHTLEEAMEQALRCEAMVFPIGLGKNLDRDYARRFNDLNGLSNLDTEQSLESILVRLAESSGGRAIISPSPGRLRRSFAEIAADLRNQYSIAYLSDDPADDGKWRKIQVLTPGRTLEVITRKGYYAPSPKRMQTSSED